MIANLKINSRDSTLAIFGFIKVRQSPLWYNRKSRHYSPGYLSPPAFDEKLQNEQKAG